MPRGFAIVPAVVLVLSATASAAQVASPSSRDTKPAATVQGAAAQNVADSALEAQTSAVASGLRCPVCQGLSIQDSPSELSQQMRTLVKEQLAAGKTPDEVRAYFVSKYGEWILLAPKPSGFNLLAYALPALLFLGGLGFVALVVRRWTAAGAPGAPVAADDGVPHDASGQS